MTRIFGVLLCSFCLSGSCLVCGCSDATNSVEMPSNPKPAPGAPKAAGADPAGKDTTSSTAPQIEP